MGLRIHGRPSGHRIDARGPCHGHMVLGRDELAVGAIDDIEEAVLGRVHQHLARLAVDGEVCLHDGGSAGVVPIFFRHFLVVPAVCAGLRVQRDDGTQEQVVAAAGTAIKLCVRSAIAGADVDQAQLRVVVDGIPGSAAAAPFPPFAGPGLRRHGHHAVGSGAVGALGRIARHEEEFPQELAGVGIPRTDKAAHTQVSAGIADDHSAVEYARCASDGIGPVLREGLLRSTRACRFLH